MLYDTKVLIIGSGPAGCSAAIYTARANLEPIMIDGMQPGGQLTVTTDVENYPGFAQIIQGPWLMDQMSKQAESVGVKIVKDHLKSINLSTKPFVAIGESGNLYNASSVIICTGAQAKWIGIESEEKFRGFGISGCATCDGFFYKNKEVMVIGGGNSAVEEALYLTNHANKVILVHRRDSLRAEKILQNRLMNHPKIEIVWNHFLEEVIGLENPLRVTAAKLKNTQDNSIKIIEIDGIFVAIGHSPNTNLFKNQLELDEDGYIITKKGSTATNIEGVYAAGDVQDKIFRQAITAAGTGCMAALEVEKFLNTPN